MRVNRVPDWMVRLDELVRARATEPYTWGQYDCCTLVADVVLAITDVDHLAELRGTYSTMAEAYRLLGRHGGLAVAITARLGEPLPVGLAQVGDIGISGTAAVFFGGDCWLGQADVGLTPVPAPALIWRCTGV